MDGHSKTIQSSQPTRKRNYDDTQFTRGSSPPLNLPNWVYISDSDSNEEEGKGKGKGKQKEKAEKEEEKPAKRQRVADYEEVILYSTDEEHRTGESAKTGEIRGALEKST